MLVSLLGCVKSPPASEPIAAPEVVWIDAFASEGGDGGVASPLKRLPPTDRPRALHLRTGTYPGPFDFVSGTTVVGHGAVVLTMEGAGPLVAARGALGLSNLSLQGGTVGVQADELQLEGVRFSSQREAGVRVVDGGVTGSALVFETRLDGVVAIAGASSAVRLVNVKASGPYRAVLSLEDCAAEVTTLDSQGPGSAVRLKGGTASLANITAAAGRGPAVSASGTTLTLQRLDVLGHEYGLLVTGGALTADEVKVVRPGAAGVAVENAAATLGRIRVERAGSLGGVQLLQSRSTLASLEVLGAAWSALFVRKGTAKVERLVARELGGELAPDGTPVGGDGLEVRDADVTATSVDVVDLAGAGLSASSGSTVTVGTLEVSRVGVSAILVERGSTVTAGHVRSRGSRGPALAAPEQGTLVVKRLSATTSDVAVWADCDTGSSVTVESLDEGTELPRLRCLKGPPR